MFLKNKILYYIVIIILLSGCSSKNYSSVMNNKLAVCPNSPNCVSSFEEKESNAYIEPLAYSSHLKNEMVVKIIIDAVLDLEKVRLIEKKDKYIHFEFRTLLGFVDDVEFLINDESNQIDFRSASRLGYYDFKKNRNRYIKIKTILEKLL